VRNQEHRQECLCHQSSCQPEEQPVQNRKPDYKETQERTASEGGRYKTEKQKQNQETKTKKQNREAKTKNPTWCEAGTWASKLGLEKELRSNAPWARGGSPTTTAGGGGAS
jgi:hypothetical protein